MTPPYPPPYPPVPHSSPKKKRWPFVLGGVVVLFVAVGIAGSGDDGSAPAGASATGAPAGNETTPTVVEMISTIKIPTAKATNLVVYRVSGAGGAKASSINYTTDGLTSQNSESDVVLPWEKTIELPGGQPMQFVSILTQGSGKGSLTATITVNGELFKQASAQGYGVATANGDIGDRP